MNKYICIKDYDGYQYGGFSFFVGNKDKESNFQIKEGTIVYIDLSDDGYQDFFDENGQKLCYMNDDYENWFQLFSKWRDLQIDKILEDGN